MLMNALIALGWTPELAVATDGTRNVLQVVGWAGGNGTAPVTGVYVGSNGFVANITDGANIAGANGGGGVGLYDGANSITSGTARFSNANGVTFGFNGQTITASVNTNYQSTGNYLTTAMQSNRGSDFMGTNTALTANGVSMTANSSGLSLNFPAFLTTAQPVGAYLTTAMLSNAATISNIKLSAGTLSTNRSDLSFNNSNGVSFGLETNGIITATVKTDYQTSGAYLTTAMQSGASTQFVQANAAFAGTNASGTIASSGISISVNPGGGAALKGSGTYTQNTGTVEFANSNGITFGLSNNGTMTASHNGLTTARASNDAIGLNSALTANGVSVTANSSGLSLNFPAFLTTAMQSGAATISNIKVSAGTLSANRSDLSFNNGNGVSFGLETNGVITASVAAAGGAQTAISGLILSNTTYTSGSASFRDLNGITWQSTTGQGIQITHDLQYTSATSSITSNAFNTSASSKFVQNWKLTGNTSGTTSSAQGSDLWLAGGNGVTISGSSNTLSFSVATNYQSQGAYLTTARASNDAIGTNTALTANGVSWTVNSSGISLNVPAFLTTADLSANSSNYFRNWKLTGNTSGTTSSQQGTDFWLAGGNGVTISGSSNTLSFSVATNYQSQGAYLTTADLSANSSKYVQEWALTGNTAGTTSSAQGTRMYFSGGNGVTISGSSNSLVFSVAAGGGVNPAASASNGSFAFTTLNFSNANNVTFGTSAGGIITASVAAPGAAAENNNHNLLGANTAGNTTASGSTIGLSGINMTLSGTNGSQIVMSVPGTSSLSGTGLVSIAIGGSTISIGVAETVLSRMIFPPFGQISSSQQTNSQMSMRYFSIDDNVSFTRVDIPMNVSIASTTTANTANIVFTSGAAIYSLNGSTLNPIVGHTNSTTYTWASNSANYSSIIGGRYASFPLATKLPPGEYWLGVFLSTNNNSSIGTATTALGNTISVFFGSMLTAQNFADFGATTGVSSTGIVPLQGCVSLSISNTTMTFQQSQITASGTAAARANIWFNLRNV